MGTAKKPGPKPKPASERQSERVEVKFTKAERVRANRAARKREAKHFASWIHDEIMRIVEADEAE